MMSYFSGLGYYIGGSGGDTIMLCVEVLASGSLNGFLSGKHYNHCKGLHSMLATAFHTLHFKSFIKQCGDISESVASKLLAIADKPQQAMQEL